jgi:hypothetical protein
MFCIVFVTESECWKLGMFPTWTVVIVCFLNVCLRWDSSNKKETERNVQQIIFSTPYNIHSVFFPLRCVILIDIGTWVSYLCISRKFFHTKSALLGAYIYVKKRKETLIKHVFEKSANFNADFNETQNAGRKIYPSNNIYSTMTEHCHHFY